MTPQFAATSGPAGTETIIRFRYLEGPGRFHPESALMAGNRPDFPRGG